MRSVCLGFSLFTHPLERKTVSSIRTLSSGKRKIDKAVLTNPKSNSIDNSYLFIYILLHVYTGTCTHIKCMYAINLLLQLFYLKC